MNILSDCICLSEKILDIVPVMHKNVVKRAAGTPQFYVESKTVK